MARAKKSKVKVSELEGQPDPRAPLDSAGLLAACQGVLARLEADLLERAKSSPAVTRALEARYQAEKAAERTAESFAGWTALLATQVAAAWVLSCVFVRTLEDRGLLKQMRLAGPGAEDSQRQFFQLAPSLTERDYLLTVFRELAHHPAARDLFDAEHSPVWKLSPSAAAAKELLALFRLPNAVTPAFRFGQASTRFLGDLYQDLSEDVRKRYALLQTPDFIESFILDRTLEPAIQRFGLDDTTLIDPTCGSGHFLLGAFDRLFEHRLRAEPGIDPRMAAVKALDCVYGADINPYAVAIARFRLTLSFLEKAGYAKLADAPALPLHLVVADSLRINAQHPQTELWQQDGVSSQHWLGEVFALEDEKAAKDVLFRQYAAVVGNPPYITVKDPALREVYRKMYVAAAGKYALSAPFCERFYQLARPRGYTGQITANSFMKREFGSQLVEKVLSAVNLELIVNTSGAYIPGHGTPTVLLFGTRETSRGADTRAVLAKRGEPSTPDDPSHGLVWRSIVEHFAEVGFDNDYISVACVGRNALAKHPWSLGGGGASELKELLEERCDKRLGEMCTIGIFGMTNADECMLMTQEDWKRTSVEPEFVRTFATGEDIRDWTMQTNIAALFPYHWPHTLLNEYEAPGVFKHLWPYRTTLWARATFGGGTYRSDGLPWWKWHQVTEDRVLGPSIAFAFIATHNHFVLDPGGKVFNRSAPIIKLPEGATEEDHLVLLAYLNSSTACFWMKQVFHDKGAGTDQGKWQAEKSKVAYEFTGTGLEGLPIPRLDSAREALCSAARELLALGEQRAMLVRRTAERLLCGKGVDTEDTVSDAVRDDWRLVETMITLQEEIDWIVYEQFGFARPHPRQSLDVLLTTRTPLGSRPFEIHLASSGATVAIDGHVLSTSANSIENPTLRKTLTQRVSQIGMIPELELIEEPHYKRRWSITPKNLAGRVLRFDDRVRQALIQAICEKLEASARTYVECWIWKAATAIAEIPLDAVAWVLGQDATIKDVKSMIEWRSVPFAAALRYQESGVHRYREWEMLWEAQRAEDDGSGILPTLPARYRNDDYMTDVIAELRGKLDVPKERFISYPGCESDNDGEPVYGWAGWDHLQRTKALASLYLNRKDVEGWTADRLTPMLAGLLELIPWVKQWHNEPSEEFGGLRMGDYYEQFLDGECRLHGLTHDDLRAWRPAKKTRGSAKGATKAKAAKAGDEVTESGNGHGGDEAPVAKKPRRKKQAAAAKEPPSSEEAE